MLIHRVISGGQIGADLAALKAAKDYGIETGGYLTKGCRTLDGPKPEYLTQYNMIESSSPAYKDRTWKNVEDSDGTIRFALDFSSPGEKCTLNGIKHHNKPYFDVDILAYRPINRMLTITSIKAWIVKNNIKTLNVAGNGNKRIESFVYNCLTAVFKELEK
jgi:hypothetical protein